MTLHHEPKIVSRANRAIEAAANSAKTQEGRNRIEEVQLHYAGVIEPGYDDDAIVATGNWNTITRWNGETRKVDDLDDVPARLGEVLEKIGVTIEWSDEWGTCDECQRLFRTSPDSYSWQRSYSMDDDGNCTCVDCIDPEGHLEALEGSDSKCNTIARIDPAKHGYVLVKDGFEHGFHEGQDASPKLIAKALRKQGIERFVFNLDNQGQFDTRFSVYVHEDEAGKLDPDEFGEAETDGPSVAGAMKAALQAGTAAASQLVGEGVQLITCNADGTAEARLVSPEEFIAGIGSK